MSPRHPAGNFAAVTPAAYIDENSGELLGRLQQLVGIATVNPPGAHYAGATAWLVRELEAVGLSARRFSMPARLMKKHLPVAQHGYPRYNVLGRWRVRGAVKTLHFNAHYDVVPVSGRWRHGSAFSGGIRGGWIYGRGTADMKGSIASLLMALRALRAAGVAPRMNVEVSFTADEETDSQLGAAWLVQHAPIRPDYAVVMEGGEGRAVCCGHNGNLWLEVEVHGQAAHGSMPERGINALEKLAALVASLEDYKLTLSRRTWRTPEGRTMRPTLNIGGVFHCGEGAKINTVPGLASFTIDRRVLPVEDHAAAERELQAFLAQAARRIPKCRITVRKVSENYSCFAEPRHPIFGTMAQVVTRVRRERAVFSVSRGFNDMHFFSHFLEIPTLGYGPGGESIHAVDERARVRELLSCAKIYAGLLTEFAG